ncbi:MAG: transporter substrate-binding domain-containing protein [Muribaculaceae bacterium]|nr:transporter substrate-binding domain-containing protein [Muribaculaceae bacterium]
MTIKNSNERKPQSRLLLYALLLALSLGLMFSLKRCQHFDVNSQDSATGDTIRVAIQYAPGSFYMEGDTLGGIDFERLNLLDLPYRLYPITNPAEGLNGLNDGRYDLVIADLPMIADSTSEYIFTTPVYVDRQVLVQRVDSGKEPQITSVVQLGGDTVCVAENSPMAARIENLSKEIGAPIFISERPVTSEKLLIELARGLENVNYAVVNESVARELAVDYPNLNYSVPVSLNQFQPWILRKSDTALRDTLNARLR